jgi:hemin uptake protein HemP
MDTLDRVRSTPAETTLAPAGSSPQRVSSESLLGHRRELVIVHNGREYHLRLTQNGKLILTA